ncbi:hypothetical protein [Phaeocystidibacter marisrubri]|uniref:hypothetical protein n=1 Tax=Phaeocystidibacter marisrubri TaxID=1577780 RepID=UPI00147852CB|nr:hypothetical protein [Phaeocystidibacter marisrubri]GGH70628.1 hypothetical protein GCM10011318_12820 [Phaeocystidibacter marisrubri]
MLRTIFEALGEFFDATFQILPVIGGPINWIIGLTIFGFAVYWFKEMAKHKAAGER